MRARKWAGVPGDIVSSKKSIEIRRRRLVKFSLPPLLSPLLIENPRAILEVITEESLSSYLLRYEVLGKLAGLA
jgi:hypothetical protein